MIVKSFKLGLISFSCLIGASTIAQASRLTPENFDTLYALAAQGNISSLNYARARGLNIDSTNYNGDTGLCIAAKRRDKRAFRAFLQSGANPSHPCTWEIVGYREFIQSTVSVPVKNMDTAPKSNKIFTSGMGLDLSGTGLDESGVGMSLGKKLLIGTGIIATGAGASLALGGGGGGGSSTNPNCVYGNWINNACVCKLGYTGEKCDTCADGYNKYGTPNCYKELKCVEGEQHGSVCRCNTGYAGELCDVCATGYGRNSAGVCIRKNNQKVMGNHFNDNFNTEDYIEDENGNKTKTITVNNYGYTDVYGMFYDADKTPHDYKLDKDSFANNYTETREIKETVIEYDYTQNDAGEIIWYSGDKDNPKIEGFIKDGKAYYNNKISENEFEYAGLFVNDEIIGTFGEIIGHAYKLQKILLSYTVLPLNDNAIIEVNNYSDSYTYGLYSNNTEKIYNIYVKIAGNGNITSQKKEGNLGEARSYIYISNRGDGNVYGIFGNKKIYSGDITLDSQSIGQALIESHIDIVNNGKGSAYGLYNDSTDGEIYNISKREESNFAVADLLSYTNVKNIGAGDAYGIYGLGKIENSGFLTSEANSGNSYGIYTKGGEITNVKDMDEDTLQYAIVSKSKTGNAYGIYAEGGKIINGRVVYAETTEGTGNAYGIYATKTKDADVTVENTSGTVVKSANGDAYGIYNYRGTVTNSTQRYEIDVTAKNGTAYGIYSDGGSVINSGRMFVFGENDAKSYGIYATNGAKITNKGNFWFNINGTELTPDNEKDYCNSRGCLTPGGAYAIYLTNGAKFVNEGNVGSDTELDLGDQGTQLGSGGTFSATKLSGNLEVASSVVNSGFENKYIVEKSIDSDDISELNITSESILFNAKLEGSDVVLNKKDFDDVVIDTQTAKFLEENYALANNEQLFSELKSKTNIKDLNLALDDLTAKDVISRFADEDLLMQNELNFDLNEQLYKASGNVFSFSSSTSSDVFNYKNGQTKYAVSGTKIGKTTLGVGLAISDIKSESTYNSDIRQSQSYQIMAPIQWKNNNINTIITPKLVYSYGTYSRDGYQNEEYKGTIEKQMAGISAQLKYPINILGFNLIPTSEANVLAYKTTIKEDKKQFSLSSVDENVYSANLGFGAYISKEISHSNTNNFNLLAGAMLYHEFANPYELKMKMNNMKGYFTLTNENRKDDYLVLRSKLSYNMDKVSIYGDMLSYIDSEVRTRVNLGFKYNF